MLKQATAISNGPTCPCMLLMVCAPWKRWTNYICHSICMFFFSIQGNKRCLLKQTCYLFLWKHKHVTDAFRAGTPIIFHQNKISSSLLLFVFDLIHFHVEDRRIIYFQMSSIYNHASAHDSGGKDIYTNEWNKRKQKCEWTTLTLCTHQQTGSWIEACYVKITPHHNNTIMVVNITIQTIQGPCTIVPCICIWSVGEINFCN